MWNWKNVLTIHNKGLGNANCPDTIPIEGSATHWIKLQHLAQFQNPKCITSGSAIAGEPAVCAKWPNLIKNYRKSMLLWNGQQLWLKSTERTTPTTRGGKVNATVHGGKWKFLLHVAAAAAPFFDGHSGKRLTHNYEHHQPVPTQLYTRPSRFMYAKVRLAKRTRTWLPIPGPAHPCSSNTPAAGCGDQQTVMGNNSID